MKRILLIFLFLLAALAGVLFALRDRFADRAVRRGLRLVEAASAGQVAAVRELRVGQVSMIGLRTVVCERVTATIHVDGTRAVGSSTIAVTLGQVVLRVASVFGGRAELSVLNGEAVVADQGGVAGGARVTDITAGATVDFAWLHPAGAARALAEEVRTLVRAGSCRIEGEFRGTARFQVGERWHQARLRSESAGGRLVMVIDPGDIRQISKDYVHPLTEAEMEIVAGHPFRAPAMLRLSEKATLAAQALRQRDRTFPEDAYRHVYWSWLLTREFGPEFSEEVTDAHEIGATYEIGSASRRMDLHNNAVGRAYALAGVPEAALVQRVLTDPNVQRARQ